MTVEILHYSHTGNINWLATSKRRQCCCLVGNTACKHAAANRHVAGPCRSAVRPRSVVCCELLPSRERSIHSHFICRGERTRLLCRRVCM